MLVASVFAAHLACGAESSRAESQPVTLGQPDLGAQRAYAPAVGALAEVRASLAKRYAAATGAPRTAIIDQARTALLEALRDNIFPAWYGMPWGMGKDSTALLPHAEGKRISCSYFVGSTLLAAGVAVEDRFAIGQAPALVTQRALVGPHAKAVHRYTSIAPGQLVDRLRALGDGLYLIGLDVHVGYVLVDGDAVDFIHSSYTGDQAVIREPVATSHAIARSQRLGYFVSALVTRPHEGEPTVDDLASRWFAEQWLTEAAVGPTRKPR